MQYVKRPIPIEAFQWAGDLKQEGVPVWLTDAVKAEVVSVWFANVADEQKGEFPRYSPVLRIKTPEGTMTAYYGDWVLRGVRGDIYPCKPDIFRETYRVRTPVGQTAAEAEEREGGE